jgi:hypothetical protein
VARIVNFGLRHHTQKAQQDAGVQVHTLHKKIIYQVVKAKVDKHTHRPGRYRFLKAGRAADRTPTQGKRAQPEEAISQQAE